MAHYYQYINPLCSMVISVFLVSEPYPVGITQSASLPSTETQPHGVEVDPGWLIITSILILYVAW